MILVYFHTDSKYWDISITWMFWHSFRRLPCPFDVFLEQDEHYSGPRCSTMTGLDCKLASKTGTCGEVEPASGEGAKASMKSQG